MTQPAKPFTAQELDQLVERTLEHYRTRAEDFREGTREHDVSQNIAALLEHIVGSLPFTILDFGCGPGRDLAAFTRLGHRAIGLEGAAPFVAMAREATGCEVWQQDFLKLSPSPCTASPTTRPVPANRECGRVPAPRGG